MHELNNGKHIINWSSRQQGSNHGPVMPKGSPRLDCLGTSTAHSGCYIAFPLGLDQFMRDLQWNIQQNMGLLPVPGKEDTTIGPMTLRNPVAHRNRLVLSGHPIAATSETTRNMHELNNGKHIINWSGTARDRTTDQTSDSRAPYTHAKVIPKARVPWNSYCSFWMLHIVPYDLRCLAH